METPFGHCLCRRTRYAFDRTAATDPRLCHGEGWRRATGAPFVGVFTLRDTAWRWKGDTPASYSPAPGVTRGFCATCGTPLFHRTEDRPGVTDFLAATLANPAEFRPARIVHDDAPLDWAIGIGALTDD